MLNHPNGNLTIAESFRGWDLEQIESICVVYLRQHEEAYGVRKMLQKQFEKLGLSQRLNLVMIEQSDSQPHTVYQALVSSGIQGPILIKDADNYFSYSPKPGNTVCYTNISEIKRGNVTNKSYILLSDQGMVMNIVEKRLISDTFCAGGYGFAQAGEFCGS